MENNLSAAIVIGIILGLIILFNFAAIFMVRKNENKITKKYKNYSRMLNNISNPYQKEDKDIDRLADLVGKIRSETKEENSSEIQ